MTEAQKYEGALYKEKPTKNQRKGKNEPKQNAKPNGNNHHRAPYVEEVPDVDDPKPAMHAPAAPTPSKDQKSSTTTNKPNQGNDGNLNVFDFLVPENNANASKVSLAEPKGQMRMVDHARSVFEPSSALAPLNTEGDDENKVYDVAYEQNGYSYGADPIPPSQYPPGPNVSTEFMTPAPKKKKDRSRKEQGQGSAAISEKKRKRRTEDVDMDDADPVQGEDTPMMDAPSSVYNNPGTPMVHSGLTGGIDRMLRSPSVEGEEQHAEHPRRRYQEPVSPIKRSRRNDKDAHNHEGGTMKSRAERFVSSMFGGSVVSASSGDTQPKALVRTRRRSSSDAENRSKKSSKARSTSSSQVVSSDPNKTKRKSSAHTDGDRPSRRQKQIEYRDGPRAGDDARDMVVYRQPNIPDDFQRDMAGHFMSLVTKGPESSRGFSVNKILKRFHNSADYDDGLDREQRMEDEKELWRTLRLKRNERGEVVVFF